jgi:hypothetical protein
MEAETQEPRTKNQIRSFPWNYLIAVLVVTAALGAISVIYPFGRDQGYHAFLADMILHGKTMYRDILMYVLPGTAMLHVVAQLFFGTSMAAIRILDLLWTMATAGFIFLFVWIGFRRRGLAVLSGVLYSFLYYLYNFWHSAQNDGFLNLPVAAGMALAAAGMEQASDSRPRISGVRLTWFAVGALLALALFFKYTILLVLPAAGVGALAASSLASARKSEGSRAQWQPVLWLGLGALATVILVFLIITISGALPGFFEGQLRMLAPYTKEGQTGGGVLSKLLRMLQSYTRPPEYGVGALLGALGLVPAIALLVRRDSPQRPVVLLILLWLLAALFSTYVQGKFFFYHYLPILPSLAMLGGLTLITVLDPFRQQLERFWVRMLLLGSGVFVLILATAYLDRYQTLFQVIEGKTKIEDYWRVTGNSNDFSVSEQMELADYLKETTHPKERVFVWADDPLVNFFSRRNTGSRFTPPIQIASWSWPGYRDELLEAFRKDTPEVFITAHNDRLPWVWGHNLDSYEALMDFPQLRDFVANNYEFETQKGRFDVLRRSNSDQLAASSLSPAGGIPPSLLNEDLDEALERVGSGKPDEYQTIIWPVALPPRVSATVRVSKLAASSLVGLRALNRSLWLKEVELSDALPALSVWIKGDNRPIARLGPLSFQSEGRNFISDEYRFTLLHICRNGLVLIYDIRPQTGEETLKQP